MQNFLSNIGHTLGGIGIWALLSIASLLNLQQIPNKEIPFGGNTAVAGKTYTLSGSGVSASQSTIGLSSFQIAGGTQKIQMTDFGSLGCGTIQPGSATKQEFVSFTGVTQNSDGSATLTGVSRGLSPIPDYSASTTLQYAHSGGSQFVLSNSPPCFYQNYVTRTNNETLTGLVNFNQPPLIFGNATSSNQAATRAYVEGVSINGAATSTETVMGISVLSTQAEVANGTASTSSGAPKVIPNRLATSSPQISAGFVPVTDSTGKIPSAFIATSSSYIFMGQNLSVGTTTPAKTFSVQGDSYISGTSTAGNLVVASSTIKIGGVVYNYPSNLSASSTLIGTDGTGKLFPTFAGQTLLFASTTASATTTFRTGTLLSGNFSTLIVEVYDPGSTSRQLSLTFNGDGDDKVSGSPKGNYGYSGGSAISGAFPSASLAFSPVLGIEPSATTSPAFIRLIINNPSSSRKFVTWDSTYVSASTTDIGWRVLGGGQWANSSSQITSILLRDFTPVSNGVDANTTFKVWGLSSL